MAEWFYKINIKQFLTEETDPLTVARVKKEVANELQTITPFRTGEGVVLVRKLLKVYTCASFNKVLDSIYDFADSERIWIG